MKLRLSSFLYLNNNKFLFDKLSLHPSSFDHIIPIRAGNAIGSQIKPETFTFSPKTKDKKEKERNLKTFTLITVHSNHVTSHSPGEIISSSSLT